MPPEWMRTSRVLPEDDEYVAVRNDDGYAVACKYKSNWIRSTLGCDDGSQYFDLDYFTHWAHMPAPPRGGFDVE
jgi:hypothetical protein